MNKIMSGVRGSDVLKIGVSVFFIAHFSLCTTLVEENGGTFMGKGKGEQ
jgi:hypothetical protein